MKNKEQWLELFDNTIERCEWFIIKYFGYDYYKKLLALAEDGEAGQLIDHLNDVWFKLPDSFNIRNPHVMNNGWQEFLDLIEYESNEEYENIVE